MKSLSQRAPGPVPQNALPQSALPQTPAPPAPLCHVTIVAPRRRADLALPADLPLPNVLPGLLRAVGEVGGDASAAPGWVLQRPGGAPLDIAQSLGALGVLDGEVLYLRPREAAMPPALFDDVADVVATGVKERSTTWTPSHTRRLGIGAAAALLAAGPLALVLAGPPWLLGAIIAGALALLLVATGAVLSRAMGDSGAGAAVGYAALPYGFLAGLLAPATGAQSMLQLGAPSLLSALAATALVAAFAGALTADGLAGFLGTAIASVAGAAGAAVVMIWGTSAAGVAAVTATVLLAFSPLIPTLSFKLARLPLPNMPTTAEELRNDNSLLDAPSIVERTAQARSYVTGMITGIALVILATQALLVLDGGWIAQTMSVVLSLTTIMRARVFQGPPQRVWLVVVGLAGIVLLAVSFSVGRGGIAAAVAAIALLWVALMAVGMGMWLPTGKPSPFWGRAGDIFDLVLIAALFPLALGVLDIYSWVRGLSG
ncbi:type VII secretion integral membrane protein EccD [Nonomuraea sp. NPDC050536]|uniref:type VII secretion integral membrane protein EccD n=1 Tax=Nonomuraea sp. NPDC050536 TaxID=3364366 RepID=UPI0037CBC567